MKEKLLGQVVGTAVSLIIKMMYCNPITFLAFANLCEFTSKISFENDQEMYIPRN
jgi:hypothetical protein